MARGWFCNRNKRGVRNVKKVANTAFSRRRTVYENKGKRDVESLTRRQPGSDVQSDGGAGEVEAHVMLSAGFDSEPRGHVRASDIVGLLLLVSGPLRGY